MIHNILSDVKHIFQRRIATHLKPVLVSDFRSAETVEEELIRSIMKGEMKLPAPEPWESRLLDAYRLSDEYRSTFDNYLWTHERDGALMKYAIKELKKQRSLVGEEEPDLEACRKTLVDLAYSYAVLGYVGWEYFSYNFRDLSIAERLSFFPETKYTQYFSLLNDQSLFSLFDNKYKTYLALKPFYKREILLVSCQDDYPAFIAYYNAHARFVIKPVTGTFGKGIRLAGRLVTEDRPETLFEELIREGPVICEEQIVSHPELARIHPQSLNTIRVFTYYDEESGEEPEIMCAMLKAGVGGTFVDNISAGGVSADVDAQTGVVITDAANEIGTFYVTHPDTGFQFRGFQIPNWESCREFCTSVAKVFPTMRFIGWDVALTEENEWVVVEGNPRGMFNALQTPAQTGMRDFFLRGFHWERFSGKGSFSIFIKGTAFRDKIKVLADGSENIYSIRRSSSLPKNIILTEQNTVSDHTSPEPIYAWFRGGTLYYFTQAEKIFLAVNPSAMFQNLKNLKEIDLSGFLSSHSIYFDHMFEGCSSLHTLDMSNLDTGKSHLMNSMFCGCSSLKKINFTGIDTTNVKNMSRMFFGCRSLYQLDLSGFDTGMTENMSAMFDGCSGLMALDLSGFNTSRVTDMQEMFHGCTRLTKIGTTGFKVSLQTNRENMFAGCDALTDGRNIQTFP